MQFEAISRRDFVRVGGASLVGASLLGAFKGAARAWGDGAGSFLSSEQLATLAAAVGQLVPSSGAGDWSAADLGVQNYIDNLLSGFGLLDAATGAVYPGGPYRNSSSDGPGFYTFQTLSRVKKIGWQNQVSTWQSLYTEGLAQLDTLAGGSFASASSYKQIAILEGLDASGSDFFAALFNHTMEGTYSHPVYGGNQGYRAWKSFGFAGDVHGVRFPSGDANWTGSSPWLPTDPTTGEGAWTVYGGYAPDEMNIPGDSSTEQPTVTPAPTTNW